ncbi:MAG: hypothetical protein HOD90_06315 [Nitrospina sp.]|nr:hypothetical protein [Nitrospina sp.]
MVKSSVPEAGIAEAVAVQIAPATATVGIVVVPDESSLDIEHLTKPEPDKRVAVIAKSPASISTPLPGVAIKMVGNMVNVVVPETPVESIAVTVAVPAGAAAKAATPVNTPVAGAIVPSEVPVDVLAM